MSAFRRDGVAHNGSTMWRSLLLLLAMFAVAPLRAQSSPLPSSRAAQAEFSYATDREAVISLAGNWRFQPGDDLRFADPAYDDSRWKLLRSGDDWAAQGYPNLSGFAWYRFRVTIPPGEERYSLLLPDIYTADQVYLDGVLVATSPGFPPARQLYSQVPVLLPVTGGPRLQPRVVSVAIRVWHSPLWANYMGGGPGAGSESVEQAGPSRLMERQLDRDVRLQRFHLSASLDLATLDILAGLTSIALYLLRRSEREYLYFGIAITVPAIPLLMWYTMAGLPVSEYVLDAVTLLSRLASRLAFIAFFYRLLQGKVTWMLRVAIAGLVLNLIPLTLLEGFGLLGVAWASLLGTLTSLPFWIWAIYLLIRRSLDRVTDARLLLVPVSLVFLLNLVSDGLGILETFNHPLSFSMSGLDIRFPIPIKSTELADGLFLLAMLAILVNRFARTRLEQDRTLSELEAARSVQQVIVPEDLPSTPGLRIETAYFPAQEVGGDFFQVIPMLHGHTLIVLGDVSGKGLPAAMSVSLAVGAIRALADYVQSPGALLTALNRRLLGRSKGFTTCVALVIAPEGRLTLANSGHLSPYLNGEELSTAPALPLGLDADAVYEDETHLLHPSDRLTLLTDGVPEATCRHALFGFERSRELSTREATYIADQARSFGQTDDITVLTIDVLGALSK